MAVTSAPPPDPSKISGSPTRAPNRPKIFWIRMGSPTKFKLFHQHHTEARGEKDIDSPRLLDLSARPSFSESSASTPAVETKSNTAVGICKCEAFACPDMAAPNAHGTQFAIQNIPDAPTRATPRSRSARYDRFLHMPCAPPSSLQCVPKSALAWSVARSPLVLLLAFSL